MICVKNCEKFVKKFVKMTAKILSVPFFPDTVWVLQSVTHGIFGAQ